MREFKKIAVLGAGANGLSIGADLINSGRDVTLIEQWPDHVEAIRRNGITVNMPGKTDITEAQVFHLCQVAEMKQKFDLVFILVKAYDTRWAAELLRSVLTDDAVVVGLQNGMTIDPLADVLGEDHVMGAVIEVCSNMFEPGVTERETPPEESWFGLGGLAAQTHQQVEEVAAILRPSGTVEIYDDIRSAKWMKLVANAAELVPSALLNLPLHKVLHLPGMRDFMEANAKEALQVCIGSGSKMVPIFGFSPADLSIDHYAVALLDEVLARFTFADTLTTVLQDWRKDRRAEIQELNGHVVSEGLKHGIPTPANKKTLEIALAIERGDIEARPENLELITSR